MMDDEKQTNALSFSTDTIDTTSSSSSSSPSSSSLDITLPLYRPPLTFVPEDVVEGTGIHVSSVLDFVTHNGPEYYSDINELDHFYARMSDGDVVMSDIGNGGGRSNDTASKWSSHYKTTLTCGIATSIVGRTVPITNVHPSNRIREFKPVRRALSSGIIKARDANLRLLSERSLHRSSGAHVQVSDVSGKEYRVVTGPYSAVIFRAGGGARVGAMTSLLKNMSMYSYGSKDGRPGLGERGQDGLHIGTWKVTTTRRQCSGWSSSSSSTLSTSDPTGAVIPEDDIATF